MSDEPKLKVTGVECAVCEAPLHLHESSGWWISEDGSFQCDDPWQPPHDPVRVAIVDEQDE